MQLNRPIPMFCSALGLALAGCATSSTGATGHPDRLDFALPNLAGEVVRPADFAGKVVLVDVWATWCDPCMTSMPVYAELANRHGKDGFVVVAVSVDEDVAAVRRFLDGRDYPFVVLLDPKGELPSAAGVRKMPTAFLLGRDGAVRHVHAGFEGGDAASIEALVVAALQPQ